SANLNEISDDLKVFPNPCKDQLTVNLSGVKRLIDAQGKTLLVSEDQTMDVSSLSPGIYGLDCQGMVVKIVKL
ncbi:MAG: Secretion system C-terminal sorting domain, partial [Bacteroidota bacterium]